MGEHYKGIINRIELIRKKKDLNKRSFCEKCGIDSNYYSQILSGRKPLNLQHILSIDNAFSIDLIWLLRGEGEKSFGGNTILETSKKEESVLRFDQGLQSILLYVKIAQLFQSYPNAYMYFSKIANDIDCVMSQEIQIMLETMESDFEKIEEVEKNS